MKRRDVADPVIAYVRKLARALPVVVVSASSGAAASANLHITIQLSL